MKMKWALLSGLFASAAVIGTAGVAQAADWKPTKPVELIAPAGPGGGWDLLARTMQKVLQEEKLVEQPVLVTNKPGGGGAAGWNYLKGKAGQGEYLAVNSTLILQNNLLGKSELTYKDFYMLANLQTEWIAVAVKKDAPWKNGKEFFEAIKKDPNGMPIGVGPSLGNNDHISFLMVAQLFGVDPKTVKFVVYPKTASEQIPAVLGGHIKAITIGLGETIEQVKAGNLRILGITADKRIEVAPDAPTWKEQGIDFLFPHWRGVQAAPGLSAEQKKFWDNAIAKMVQSPAWKKALDNLDWDPYYQNSADFTKFLEEKNVKMGSVLKDVGLIK